MDSSSFFMVTVNKHAEEKSEEVRGFKEDEKAKILFSHAKNESCEISASTCDS